MIQGKNPLVLCLSNFYENKTLDTAMPVAHKHVHSLESRCEITAGKYKIYVVISYSCMIVLQNGSPGPS
ncbi:MAG: hypothetical protein LC657_07300, partial [Desulfobacteraceae bacterium]|nr:hypothetical protein [Desulfobacteraceae bacterium]